MGKLNVDEIRRQCSDLRKLADKIELLTYEGYVGGDDPVKLIIHKSNETSVHCSNCRSVVNSPDIYCRYCGVKFNGCNVLESMEDTK